MSKEGIDVAERDVDEGERSAADDGTGLGLDSAVSWSPLSRARLRLRLADCPRKHRVAYIGSGIPGYMPTYVPKSGKNSRNSARIPTSCLPQHPAFLVAHHQ